MEKKLKNILWTSGVIASAAALTSVTSYCVTKYLMHVALDRQLPKAPKSGEKLISGSDFCQDFLDEVEQTSKKLEEMENETVNINAHDGTPLVGHWLPCENPKRILIAMHGWRSSWHRDFGMISDFWHDNGCSVLYAEQRGQGSSGGDYMGFGLTERYDCLDWVNWVNETQGAVLPIYLCGVSMGAATVLMASGLDLPENVHGICADCGFTSPDAIWQHVVNDNLHIPFAMYRKAANDICRKKIDFGSKDYSTVDALKTATVPVLFAHGTDDTFVPVKMTFENYKACASPKKLFVVPGADHGMSYYVDRAGYEAVSKEFWNEYDGYIPTKKCTEVEA